MSDLHRSLQNRSLPSSDPGKGAGVMLGFRSRKLDFSVPASERKGILRSRKRENDTSEAAYRSPRKKVPAQLPERYALLESFYEGVETAFSLLGIRQQLCTFQAVCTTVEATTKRRFLQKHLAQIKFILPEAVLLEYVNVYDPDTRSKKWELKVTLVPMPAEAAEPPRGHGSTSKRPKSETVQRRRTFHARLVKFASNHSEDDDVPQHPMPERSFSRISSSKGMPMATTCIPMDIITTRHRMAVPESDTIASTHFSKSFKTSFSLEAGKHISANSTSTERSPIFSGLADTILPMPINRRPHREVHNLAEKTLGTPHLAPSFRPFFSVQRSVSEKLALASENLEGDATLVDNTRVASAVPLTPMKRRHAGPEEEEAEPEIREPVELQTPIKIVKTYGTPSQVFVESPSKRPHFSPAFKSHFSSPMHPPASRTILSTPVKASVSKEVPISWDVRTPGKPVEEEECAGLKTPVKSSIKAHSFQSPAPTSKHQLTPCTPQNSESSVYVTSLEPGSASQGSWQSPTATPVKPASSIRSLNFASPKRSPKDSPCPCSPGMDVPSTPGVQTPVNPSRFRNKVAMKHSKLNLGPLFDETNDDYIGDETRETRSQSCATERSSALLSSSSVTPALRKSLSFASEEDMQLIQGLPTHLVHSVMKEELKVAEERSIDVVGLRHRQQIMAGLPHLFNQLRLIFQSSNKSVFPYHELLSKVVSSNTEMTDRTEVEERLKMLLELAPEWISAKKSLSGDMLYRVDKRVDVLSVRKKLCGGPTAEFIAPMP